MCAIGLYGPALAVEAGNSFLSNMKDIINIINNSYPKQSYIFSFIKVSSFYETATPIPIWVSIMVMGVLSTIYTTIVIIDISILNTHFYLYCN